jgi:hypothetical protein
MIITCAWADENASDVLFEQRIPLLFFGRRSKWQESKSILTVLFLDGYERLSSRYISQLKSYGIRTRDVSMSVRRLTESFSNLKRFGRYEMLCFLRWPIIAEYAKNNDIKEQLIHIDADVVFNATIEEVVDDVRGLTFVLQGCPAFITISRYEWFDYYYEELSRLAEDIVGYSHEAWNERIGWEKSWREKWAGSRYRPIISSDQDLVSHLIHTGRIIQDNPLDFVKRCQLFYMENPLYLDSHASLQLAKSSHLTFSSDGHVCYLEGKKIALWHFQSDFLKYVNAAVVLSRLHWPFRYPNHLLGRRSDLVSTLARRVFNMSRAEGYNQIKEINPEQADNGFSFVDLFNPQKHWKKNVFDNSISSY